MSDDSLRRLEHDWRANPSDQVLLGRLVLERERAGLPLSGDMLEARAFPEREFDCKLPLQVQVLEPGARRTRGLGRTPAKDGKPIQIPSHCAWWVLPIPPGDVQLERLRELVVEESIPGLSFEKRKIDDRKLERFSGLDLIYLSLTQCKRITDRGLASVASMKSLGWLDLERTGATDAGLGHLVELPQLFSLKVWAEGSYAGPTPISTAGARILARCKTLKHLTFGGGIDSAGLAALASLPRLQSLDLNLSRAEVGTEDLAPLSHARALRELSLDSFRVTHLRHLRSLTSLRYLKTPGGLDAAGLEPIIDLPHLERLDLGAGTTITDELLEVLATLSALKILDVGANTFDVKRGTAGLPSKPFDLCYNLPPDPSAAISSLQDFLPNCKKILPHPKRRRR